MTPWATQAAAIADAVRVAAFGSAVPYDFPPARWPSEEPGFLPPNGVELVARVISVDPSGSDARRFKLESGEIVERNVAWARLTVQVFAQTQADTDDRAGHAVLGAVSVRIRRETIRESLQRAALALVEVGQITPVQIDADGWAVSAFTLDLVFSAVLVDDDLETAGRWIERFTLSSDLDGNVENEEIIP